MELNKKRTKLQCLIQERKLTPKEPNANPNKKNTLTFSVKTRLKPN